MAKKTSKPTKKTEAKESYFALHRLCDAPAEQTREFGPDIHPERGALILLSGSKWVAGTVLHYYFFESPSKWKGTTAQKRLVRDAFDAWKSLDIGLEFREVQVPHEAEVRIGFEKNDGHWSYLGRGVLQHGASDRTMNLDGADQWNIDTAIHEIGHTLGFPHEHQNPNAGIEWDEDKVYAALARPPNSWPREKTHYNIIRKINPSTVLGSNWDKDSVMHYPFEAGLIIKPTGFENTPLEPAPGISEQDVKMVRTFYPPLPSAQPKKLTPFKSEALRLSAGEQAHFRFTPKATRTYQLSTFGECDTVMVLFEIVDGEQRFRAGDDDSAEDRNATISEKLFAGKEYIVRLRLYWAFSEGDTAVMVW